MCTTDVRTVFISAPVTINYAETNDIWRKITGDVLNVRTFLLITNRSVTADARFTQMHVTISFLLRILLDCQISWCTRSGEESCRKKDGCFRKEVTVLRIGAICLVKSSDVWFLLQRVWPLLVLPIKRPAIVEFPSREIIYRHLKASPPTSLVTSALV